VEIDQKILSNDNAKWIGLLSEIITEDQEPGRFELEGFVITVNRTRNLNKTLIPIQNEFFN
jgi:hypothetical protein